MIGRVVKRHPHLERILSSIIGADGVQASIATAEDQDIDQPLAIEQNQVQNGLNELHAQATMCLSTGSPPVPAVSHDANFGPQVLNTPSSTSTNWMALILTGNTQQNTTFLTFQPLKRMTRTMCLLDRCWPLIRVLKSTTSSAGPLTVATLYTNKSMAVVV